MWAVMSVGAHYTRDGIKAEITEIQPVCPVLGLRSLPCWCHPIFLEKLLPSLHDLAQEQQRLCSWPLAHHTCTPSTGVDSAVAAHPRANQSLSLSVKVDVYRRPGTKNIWEGLSPPSSLVLVASEDSDSPIRDKMRMERTQTSPALSHQHVPSCTGPVLCLWDSAAGDLYSDSGSAVLRQGDTGVNDVTTEVG